VELYLHSPICLHGIVLNCRHRNNFTFYSSANEDKRNAYRISVGKPEGKRPLGRTRRRWEDNIKMDFREIGWGGMDWIDLAQDRDQWRTLMNTVMNLRVP
jgi:hypothetical protein